MLSRNNTFTYYSYHAYRKFLTLCKAKTILSEVIEILNNLIINNNTHTNHTIDMLMNNYQIENQIYNEFFHILDHQQGQSLCLFNRTTQNNYVSKRLYQIYKNYNKLLIFYLKLCQYLKQDQHIKIWLKNKERKNILVKLIHIIQSYLSFNCRDWSSLQRISSDIQELSHSICINNQQQKKQYQNQCVFFGDFSLKISLYIKIFHKRFEYSCEIAKILQNNLSIISAKHQEISFSEIIDKIDQGLKKNIIGNFIDLYIREKEHIEYKCLNCQKSFYHFKLLKHVELCKKKYQYDRLLQQNYKQISPKLLDLNGILTKIQTLYKEKQKNNIQNLGKNNKKSKFFINKQFSKTANFNKRDANQFDSVGSDDQSIKQIKKQIKKINQLSSIQLKQLIKIIQKLQSIGQKIKISRHSTNLLLFYDLRDVKNSIQKSFQSLSVDCQEVKIFLKLLIDRYHLLQDVKKNNNKAKQSGFDTDQEYLSLQNVEVSGISTQPKKQMKFVRKKKYKQAQDIYFSEDETFSPSSQIFEDKPNICVQQFQIIKILGSGSYSTVYLVKKKTTGQKYAMKKIEIQNYKQYYETKKMNENLQNQQCVFQVTNSPFAVKAFYSFSQNQYHYFIMEYCPNGDFAELLKHQTRLTQNEAKLYLAEIVEALDYLHQKDIIHRDLKPHNVVIDQKWHIKLTDYGLSDAGVKNKKNYIQKPKNLSKFALQSRKCRVPNYQIKKKRGIIGTPYYMAPEVMEGQPATFLSDWWSFGIIMYQILIGTPPFLGSSRQQIQQKVMKRELWPPQIEFGYQENMISYQAKDLIEKLLMIQPRKRIGKDVLDIKDHKFFDDVNWDDLFSMDPPDLYYRKIIRQQVGQKSERDKQQQQDSQKQNHQNDKWTQTKSSKSFSRQFLVRRDLLNSDTQTKYKARQIEYEKLRRISRSIRKLKLNNLLCSI